MIHIYLKTILKLLEKLKKYKIELCLLKVLFLNKESNLFLKNWKWIIFKCLVFNSIKILNHKWMVWICFNLKDFEIKVWNN